MDLKSCLAPGDLFISFWLGDQLTVVAGDYKEIISVENLETDGLADMIHEFEKYVSREDHYAALISNDRRSGTLPKPVISVSAFSQLSIQLSLRLVTPRVSELLSTRVYRRLLLFPDGILNALPIDLLLRSIPWDLSAGNLSDGVVYAPSASAYAYAHERRRQGPLRHALVLVGDRDDRLLADEAQRIATYLPCQSTVVTTMIELQEETQNADLLYIASHGAAPDAEDSHRGWSILFDGAVLRSEDFYRERVRLNRGSLVVLSACSVGRLTAGSAHELEGLVHALFYGGASSVLAARWAVLYETAEAVFLGAIDAAFREPSLLSTAFSDSIKKAAQRKDVLEYMASPESALFLLGPFALFGCGD